MRYTAASIVAILTVSTLAAADYKSTGTQSVVAHIKAPMGLNIEAKSSSMTVKDDGSIITLTIPVETFKTGIGLRDSHMMEAIEAPRYPTVMLIVKHADIKRLQSDDSQTADISGILTFHGVSRPVGVHYTAATDCERHVGVNASFSFDLRDFEIRPPGYAGIDVKPNVKVEAKLALQDI